MMFSSVARTSRRVVSVQSKRIDHRRTYMDVHTRPSHSRMFAPETSHFTQKKVPPPQNDPFPEWNVYTILAQRAAMAFGMIYCCNEYICSITLCEGPSMEPTIHRTGQMIFIEKVSKHWYGVHDGPVAAQRVQAAQERQGRHSAVDEWHEPFVRVNNRATTTTWRQCWKHVCSPICVGDVVVAEHPSKNGTVCKRILGLPGDQVLLSNGKIETIQDGHVWLEGDNPFNSSDSRSYGSLPLYLIQGKVLFRVWNLEGHAWMTRGLSPSPHNSTVLPAGYAGEHVVKQEASSDVRPRKTSS